MLKRYVLGFTLAAGILTLSQVQAGPAPQTSSVQGVTVTVTPPDFSPAAKTWDFDVALETHTRDLGEDLAQSTVLIAHEKQFAPLGWEGATQGGHHRKGKLRFAAIVPRPMSLELQIRLAGEVTPRSFRWALKGGSDGN